MPIYSPIGSILRQNGELDAERRLYAQAVAQGVWRHPSQRPGYLAAQANANTGPWPTVAKWPVLERCVSLLESGFPEIQGELLRSIETSTLTWDDRHEPASNQSWGAQDLEGLTSSGQWHQNIYIRNGLPAATSASFAARFPHTTRIVQDAIDTPSAVLD